MIKLKKNGDYMNLEQEIERIIYSTNNFWSDLEKARHVYIEVGKLVEKNSEFFLTQAKKLQNNSLSKEEMERIYDISEHMFESADWFRVICRSGAKLLKIIYDRLNINSHMVKSIDYMRLNQEDKVKVYHWILFLDINDKHYALTISHDLANIKNNYQTEYFGSKYPKANTRGEVLYDGEDLNFQEIDKNELESIDKKINYINSYYKQGNKYTALYDDYSLELLQRELIANKMYYEIKVQQIDIYQKMFRLKDGNDNETNVTSIPLETLFIEYYPQLIENVCIEVERNLKQKLGIIMPAIKFNYTDINKWFKHMCSLLQEEFIYTYDLENKELFEINDNFDFPNFRKKQRHLVCPYKYYDDILQLLDQVYSYIDTLTKLNKIFKSHKPSKEDLRIVRKLKSLHFAISTHFLPERVIFEKNIEQVNGSPYVKSNYINEKFKTLFPIIFSANDSIQSFNKFGYSEQIHSLNKIMPYLFNELTRKNCDQATEYNPYIKPVLNRIRLYTLFNERTKSYEIIFHIPSFYDFEDEFYYRYELRENNFSQIDIIEDVYNNPDYEIISTSLKERFQENQRNTAHFDELLDDSSSIKLK